MKRTIGTFLEVFYVFPNHVLMPKKEKKRAHSAPASVSSFVVWLKCNVLHQNRGTVQRLFLCVTNDFPLSPVCCTARHWHDKHNTEQSVGMGLLEDLPCLLCRAQLRKKIELYLDKKLMIYSGACQRRASRSKETGGVISVHKNCIAAIRAIAL